MQEFLLEINFVAMENIKTIDNLIKGIDVNY